MSLTDALQPIRDVARITGVNAVTLRAWERRYGLIKPHRSAKGHRLYSAENIQRIQDILTWLNRGVAVSQVKELLRTPATRLSGRDSPWNAMRQRFVEALLTFDSLRLDQHYNQAMSLYPTTTVCAQLLEPVLAQMQQRWQGQFGNRLEQVFLHTWLRCKMAARIYHNNCNATGCPVLLASLSDQQCEPGMWLLALMLSADGYRVELLEWEVPASELSLLVERLTPLAVVLFSSQSLAAVQLRQQLPKLVRHLPDSLFAAGPAAAIHTDELLQRGMRILAEQPTRAHAQLLEQLRVTA